MFCYCQYISNFSPSQNVAQGSFVVETMQKSRRVADTKITESRWHSLHEVAQTQSNQLNPEKQVKLGRGVGGQPWDKVFKRQLTTQYKCQVPCPKASIKFCFCHHFIFKDYNIQMLDFMNYGRGIVVDIVSSNLSCIITLTFELIPLEKLWIPLSLQQWVKLCYIPYLWTLMGMSHCS